ncbi:protein-tyrosine phosphatase-like protein [Echria macrotheca]|uniref:protein-tyrosine-phosphatase n=1 Tax=Echria macrotheca TaxID=438768 RepID=A0AAJ0BHR8_9PEZI|nr:protein-tyrosine phosphatase-like protein [Echria macrotheca]
MTSSIKVRGSSFDTTEYTCTTDTDSANITMGKTEQNVSTPDTKQPAACILPDLLYLGPVSATANTAFLERQGITHILSVGRGPASHIPGITYARLTLTDHESSSIKHCTNKACELIDAVLNSNGRVLVHCVAGISRSPTMIAAYLMKRLGMTLRESLTLLVEARAVVAPNPGFLRQLSEMEKDIFNGKSTFDPAGVTSSTRLAAYLERTRPEAEGAATKAQDIVGAHPSL